MFKIQKFITTQLKTQGLQSKSLGLMTVLASAILFSACQPVEKNKDKQKQEVDQHASSEPVVEALALIGSTQNVPVVLEPCRGNNCPEVSIDRLSTNQPLLDQVIDQAILQHLKSTIEVDEALQKNLAKQTSASEANASNSVSEAHVQKTASQLLAEQLQPYVNNFLKLDDQLKKLGVNQKLSLNVSAKILNAQQPLATVVVNSSHYLGGAHGSAAQHYYNYDLQAQKIVQLNQLIQPSQQLHFKQLAYDAFKLWVTENKLAENVQEYEQAWKFELSKNYYLGQQGLILQYQEYEIGPYVVGLPRLVIPYEDLKSILKAEYLPAAFKQPANSEAEVSAVSSSNSSKKS